MANRLRGAILDLLLERAATINELTEALGRPRSTVAHHVDVLVDAGLVRVVRTRRVRAIEERFYGRTARLFRVGVIDHDGDVESLVGASSLSEAAREAEAAHRADQLRCTLRHVRIPADQAADFWSRVVDLAQEFARLPRGGDVVHGFVAGLYPTDHPRLPAPD